ncbi:MAG: MoaD/ThiS family protein [Thermodesulfobacteriota bacterium]|nr:MoaD/ThiS family protein [Thermodesulfobacteriota bacterium]
MATILFNAFSFLQKKLREQGQPYSNVSIDVDDRITVMDLMTGMGISSHDVEAVFINGSVKPLDTLLQDGDRVALVPPGAPGPYRVLLGMIKKSKTETT